MQPWILRLWITIGLASTLSYAPHAAPSRRARTTRVTRKKTVHRKPQHMPRKGSQTSVPTKTRSKKMSNKGKAPKRTQSNPGAWVTLVIGVGSLALCYVIYTMQQQDGDGARIGGGTGGTGDTGDVDRTSKEYIDENMKPRSKKEIYNFIDKAARHLSHKMAGENTGGATPYISFLKHVYFEEDLGTYLAAFDGSRKHAERREFAQLLRRILNTIYEDAGLFPTLDSQKKELEALQKLLRNCGPESIYNLSELVQRYAGIISADLRQQVKNVIQTIKDATMRMMVMNHEKNLITDPNKLTKDNASQHLLHLTNAYKTAYAPDFGFDTKLTESDRIARTITIQPNMGRDAFKTVFKQALNTPGNIVNVANVIIGNVTKPTSIRNPDVTVAAFEKYIKKRQKGENPDNDTIYDHLYNMGYYEATSASSGQSHATYTMELPFAQFLLVELGLAKLDKPFAKDRYPDIDDIKKYTKEQLKELKRKGQDPTRLDISFTDEVYKLLSQSFK